MKKTFKKFLAILLVIMTLLSVSVLASSAVDKASEDPIVAKMYMWIRITGVGHSGVYFENLTNHDLTVGCYTLPAGKGVTISATNTSRSDGKGNYYNIDAYMLYSKGMSNMVWLGKEITQSQLDKASAKILSRNTWTGLKNCDYFSTSVFNSVGGKAVKYSPSPVVQKYYMKKSPFKCSSPTLYKPTKAECLKQVGTNSGAYLKACSSGSFRKAVG